MSSDRVRWLLLAVAAGVLVAHALTYNFVTDDAYISFVFSRNLAEHGQLAFNLGHPVEGYTNFLWTVLLALGLLARGRARRSRPACSAWPARSGRWRSCSG